MKTIRKIISIMVTLNILTLVFMPLAIAGQQTSNYDFLIEQGYPAEYLDKLTEEYIAKMVDMIGTDHIEYLETRKYTLDEKSRISRANINPGSMTLQITTGYVYYQNSTKVKSAIVSASWEWAANKPAYRGRDAVAVNWDTSVFNYLSDSFYATDVYKSNESDDWSTFKETNDLSSAQQGGIGHYTDLKAFKKYVGGMLLFGLSPKKSMYKGTKYSTVVNIEYAHAPMPLTGISFSVKGVGVGISFNVSCDTMAGSSTLKYKR